MNMDKEWLNGMMEEDKECVQNFGEETWKCPFQKLRW
jgi:hypothetical protein